MSDHTAQAHHHLEVAQGLGVKIGAILANPAPEDRSAQRVQVDRLATRQRARVKLAEVYALLALGQKLDDLARTVEGVR